MKKLSEVFLISEELLKLYSDISRNVGVDKLVGYLNLAQPFYIEPILGLPLMQELQEQIASDSLTALNKALILKIAPCLSLYTQYLAIRGLSYTITQKGVTVENSENSRSINEHELECWRNEILSEAEMAKELLIKYLCNCRDNYPLWFPSNDCNCEKFKPKGGSASLKHEFGHIYFPNKIKECGDCGCYK